MWTTCASARRANGVARRAVGGENASHRRAGAMRDVIVRASSDAEDAPVCVVTGANTGLGYETAKAATKRGARVVLASRDLTRCENARTRLLAATPTATVDVIRCDLGSFESVRTFAETFHAKYQRLDVLVCNSGVMALPNRETTVDGNETQMQVNHLGHFLLTSLLLQKMVETPGDDKRIVNVSSVAHNLGTFDFHNINSEGPFGLGYPFLGWATYGRTKMANILFTYELNRRLRARGIEDVSVNAVHPGVVETELNRSLSLDFYPQMKKMGRLITPEQGARGQIALAFDDKYKGVSGIYVSEMSDAGRPGQHEVILSNEFSYNEEAQARLWKDSVRLTKATWAV